MSKQPDILDKLLAEEIEVSEQDTFIHEDIILESLLDEINLIHDQGIKLFVRALLLQVTEFWAIPSSFDENQIMHPPDEADAGGNVIHTKRVVRLVNFICESQDRNILERDYLLAAAILHDLTKAVTHPDGSITYDPMHPYTLDRIVEMAMLEDSKHASADKYRSNTIHLDDEGIAQILRLVRCHLGLWGPVPETYPLTTMDWTLHLADYLASKLHIIIDGDDFDIRRWTLDEPNSSEEKISD